MAGIFSRLNLPLNGLKSPLPDPVRAVSQIQYQAYSGCRELSACTNLHLRVGLDRHLKLRAKADHFLRRERNLNLVSELVAHLPDQLTLAVLSFRNQPKTERCRDPCRERSEWRVETTEQCLAALVRDEKRFDDFTELIVERGRRGKSCTTLSLLVEVV